MTALIASTVAAGGVVDEALGVGVAAAGGTGLDAPGAPVVAGAVGVAGAGLSLLGSPVSAAGSHAASAMSMSKASAGTIASLVTGAAHRACGLLVISRDR